MSTVKVYCGACERWEAEGAWGSWGSVGERGSIARPLTKDFRADIRAYSLRPRSPRLPRVPAMKSPPKMPLQIRRNCPLFLRENLLTLLTVIGVVSGTLLGWGLRASGHEWSRRDVMYFQYPGELFLRMLKSLIVPLLVSSIVSAIGSLDLSLSGKVGLRAIIYYMTTTVCAVMLGIALVTTIKPGKDPEAYSQPNATKVVTKDTLTSDTLLDLIRCNQQLHMHMQNYSDIADEISAAECNWLAAFS
ncbi:Excitatory amino acid transporter 3 [Papilio xuthus]|uniref:Amino acid transporter n=1 Tax=Papilio xuthus TaxID=66420 RepID=A0A0N1IN87_PAPXU|nr:Excitatory amino acid transporter 3 [Papilio xuthus]